MLSEVVFLRNKMAYISAWAEILGILLSAVFALYFKLVSLFHVHIISFPVLLSPTGVGGKCTSEILLSVWSTYYNSYY